MYYLFSSIPYPQQDLCKPGLVSGIPSLEGHQSPTTLTFSQPLTEGNYGKESPPPHQIDLKWYNIHTTLLSLITAQQHQVRRGP